MKQWLTRKRAWLLVSAVLAVVLVIVLWPRDEGPLEVPLGVEHAMTLTFPGPELKVKPYGYGVAVSLRIADIKEHNGRRTYDIRYMLNRGGTYNITDYLTTVEGTDPVGMPAFTVVGLETLSQGVDKRIQELSEVRIDIWHFYYETMAVIIALWVLWLGLIIFWPRKREAMQELSGAVREPFADRLRRYLEMANADTLSETDKARMEMMLIDHWRMKLPNPGPHMHTTVRRIRQDPGFGTAYHTLIDWLHNPTSSITKDQLIQQLTPYTRVDEEGGVS